MNRLFGRSKEPRRNSDDDYNKMQYYTPRGVIPTKVVEEQVQEVTIDTTPGYHHGKGYPHAYQNNEVHGENFAPYERRNRPAETPLYEVPVGSRMQFGKAAASANTVNRPVQHNDRGRVARREPNDPGAFRGVVAVDQNTSRSYGVAGVIYHPEGEYRRFDRAAVEPLSREGRQYLRRYADDAADSQRVCTWPPRDEDAADLEMYEDRYKKVRKPKPVQQQKKKKNT
ncbi:hypothetical protein ACHAPI_004867 [Fusarium lateritium]